MATRANSKWVKGKQPVINEYAVQKREMFSATAGRGFIKMPGFLYQAHNDLELAAKLKLSDLNYQILVEMVEADLKQSGLDYDLAHKNAVIAWEIDKRALLDSWERELAQIKLEMADDENAVKLLAIEVAKRAAALIRAKTLIEIEAEEIRKQIALLGGQTADLEVQRAQAKVATAQRKLSVVPLLEQLIDIENEILAKEWEILSKNQGLVDRQSDILAVAQQIVGKAYELLPIQEQMVGKTEELIEKESEIIDKNIELLTKEEEIVSKQDEINTKVIEVIEKEEEVLEKKETLIEARSEVIDKDIEIAAKQEEYAEAAREVVLGQDAIIEKAKEVINKTGEALAKEDELADKETPILNIIETEILVKEAEVTEKQDELITLAEEIAVLSREIVDKREDLLVKEEELAGKESEIQDIIEDIAGVVEEISLRKKDIAEIYEDIGEKTKEILDAEEDLLDKEEAVADASEENMDKQEELVDAEDDYIDDRIASMEPAIESLLSILEEYITELDTQKSLYDDIYTERQEIADIRMDQAEKQADIVTAQENLTAVIVELADELKALSEYKKETLAPELTNLIAALDQYIEEIPIQSALEKDIIDKRKEIVELESDDFAKKYEMAELERDIEEVRKEIKEYSLDKARYALDHDIEIAAAQERDFDNLHQARLNYIDNTDAEAEVVSSEIKDAKETTGKNNIDARAEYETTTDGYQRYGNDQIANRNAIATREIAAINAAKEVTAQLKHLLG